MSIETSTKCACGTFVVLSASQRWITNGGWDVICPTCYGPVEDSGDRDRVLGWGKTPDDALADWQEKHDEAWEVEWRITQPNTPDELSASVLAQMAAERDRQRGWQFDYAALLFEAGTPLSEVQKQVAKEAFLPDPHTNYIDYGPQEAA